MARLILKSPFLKGGKNAGGHVRYIATRDRVELVPDGRPATQKQAQLIDSLTKDFPDAKKLPEYGGYQDTPTKASAPYLTGAPSKPSGAGSMGRGDTTK